MGVYGTCIQVLECTQVQGTFKLAYLLDSAIQRYCITFLFAETVSLFCSPPKRDGFVRHSSLLAYLLDSAIQRDCITFVFVRHPQIGARETVSLFLFATKR